jgi:hypothetical protein
MRVGKSDKRVRARAPMRVLCVVTEYGSMTPVTGVDKDRYLVFVGIPKPPVSAHFSHHVAHAQSPYTRHSARAPARTHSPARTPAVINTHTLVCGARASRRMPLEARAGNASARLTRECFVGVWGGRRRPAATDLGFEPSGPGYRLTATDRQLIDISQSLNQDF